MMKSRKIPEYIKAAHEWFGGDDVAGFVVSMANEISAPPVWVTFSIGSAYLERHSDIPKVLFVICAIHQSGQAIRKGFSYCSPDDTFNPRRGMSIALRRALTARPPLKMLRISTAFRQWIGVAK